MEISEKKPACIPTKKLYYYQENDIARLFKRLETNTQNCRLLYQLPTGGGKTIIFSEIAAMIQKIMAKRQLLTSTG